MKETMKTASLPLPELKTEGMFTVTFRRIVEETVEETVEIILKEMKNNLKVTMKQLSNCDMTLVFHSNQVLSNTPRDKYPFEMLPKNLSLQKSNLAWELNYIVTHELAHIIHPNHTPEFWNELDKVIPNYAEYDNWLKRNGVKMAL
jgi:hypothetical protein